MGPDTTPRHSWKIRRTFMFLIAAFCCLMITLALLVVREGPVAETVVTMGFTTLIGIIGSYVFGATWDDKGRQS